VCNIYIYILYIYTYINTNTNLHTGEKSAQSFATRRETKAEVGIDFAMGVETEGQLRKGVEGKGLARIVLKGKKKEKEYEKERERESTERERE